MRQVPTRVHHPATCAAVLLLGGFLTFYLVGFALIAVGIWMWSRKRPVPTCVECGSRQTARG